MCVLLKFLGLDTINRSVSQWLLMNFGPFGGIFGYLTQHLRYIASDKMALLCYFDILNISHENKFCLGYWKYRDTVIIYGEITCWPTFLLYEIIQYYLKYSFFHICLKIKTEPLQNNIDANKVWKMSLFCRILDIVVPNQVYKSKYGHYK